MSIGLLAQALLDFMLDRQTVRIPAGFARHVVAAHGLVAREDVLERARQHMVDAGLAVRGRRTFIETELRAVFGLLERLLENVVLTPELQHLFLEGWSVVAP